jgi:LDH2 family malate/lactate/ureidoglycolate dehydrogenase
MAGPDYSSRRHLGHFFLVMKPEAFIDRDLYFQQMKLYLTDLRAQAAQSGAHVLAAGDREWAEQEKRLASGIPIDHAVLSEFSGLAREFELESLI